MNWSTFSRRFRFTGHIKSSQAKSPWELPRYHENLCWAWNGRATKSSLEWEHLLPFFFYFSKLSCRIVSFPVAYSKKIKTLLRYACYVDSLLTNPVLYFVCFSSICIDYEKRSRKERTHCAICICSNYFSWQANAVSWCETRQWRV